MGQRHDRSTKARGVIKCKVGDFLYLKEGNYMIKNCNIVYYSDIFPDHEKNYDDNFILANTAFYDITILVECIKKLERSLRTNDRNNNYVKVQASVKFLIPDYSFLKPSAYDLHQSVFKIDQSHVSKMYKLQSIGQYSHKKLHMNTSAHNYGIYENNAKNPHTYFLIDSVMGNHDKLWIPGPLIDFKRINDIPY